MAFPSAFKVPNKKRCKKLSNRWKAYETFKSMLMLSNLTPEQYQKKLKEFCTRERI
jgi:hypothetical protein